MEISHSAVDMTSISAKKIIDSTPETPHSSASEFFNPALEFRLPSAPPPFFRRGEPFFGQKPKSKYDHSGSEIRRLDSEIGNSNSALRKPNSNEVFAAFHRLRSRFFGPKTPFFGLKLNTSNFAKQNTNNNKKSYESSKTTGRENDKQRSFLICDKNVNLDSTSEGDTEESEGTTEADLQQALDIRRGAQNCDDMVKISWKITACQVIEDWDAEEEGDLSIERGQLLQIDDVKADGWWKVTDEKGRTGIVPSTYLRVVDPKDERIYAQSDTISMWGWNPGVGLHQTSGPQTSAGSGSGSGGCPCGQRVDASMFLPVWVPVRWVKNRMQATWINEERRREEESAPSLVPTRVRRVFRPLNPPTEDTTELFGDAKREKEEEEEKEEKEGITAQTSDKSERREDDEEERPVPRSSERNGRRFAVKRQTTAEAASPTPLRKASTPTEGSAVVAAPAGRASIVPAHTKRASVAPTPINRASVVPPTTKRAAVAPQTTKRASVAPFSTKRVSLATAPTRRTTIARAPAQKSQLINAKKPSATRKTAASAPVRKRGSFRPSQAAPKTLSKNATLSTHTNADEANKADGTPITSSTSGVATLRPKTKKTSNAKTTTEIQEANISVNDSSHVNFYDENERQTSLDSDDPIDRLRRATIRRHGKSYSVFESLEATRLSLADLSDGDGSLSTADGSLSTADEDVSDANVSDPNAEVVDVSDDDADVS